MNPSLNKEKTLKSESEKHSVISDSLRPHGLYSPWNSLGQNTGVGQPIPSPADLANPGIKPGSPALQADSLPTELEGKPRKDLEVFQIPSFTYLKVELPHPKKSGAPKRGTAKVRGRWLLFLGMGSSRQVCSTNEKVKASHATRASEGIYSILFRKLHKNSTRGVMDEKGWSFYMRYGLRNVCR